MKLHLCRSHFGALALGFLNSEDAGANYRGGPCFDWGWHTRFDGGGQFASACDGVALLLIGDCTDEGEEKIEGYALVSKGDRFVASGGEYFYYLPPQPVPTVEGGLDRDGEDLADLLCNGAEEDCQRAGWQFVRRGEIGEGLERQLQQIMGRLWPNFGQGGDFFTDIVSEDSA